MQPTMIALFVVAMALLLIAAQNRRNAYLAVKRRKKKKGNPTKMPQELIREFIGKRCSVSVMGESFGEAGRITAAEENWIRFEPENKKRGPVLINGDLILQIRILPEKN